MATASALRKDALALYRACMRSARKCPEWEQREMMKTNQDAAKEIRDVLTDEQEKKLEERMQARRGEMRENLRERRPGRAAPGRPRLI